jgi:hypothetical protein
MEYFIEKNPTIKHLDEITKWLNREYKQFGEGFIVNWNEIQNAFERGVFMVFLKEGKPIGFVTFSENDTTVEINLFCIQYKYRGLGYGLCFLKELEIYLKSKKIIAVSLFCEPIQSESFWKKAGFYPAPKTVFNDTQLTYWKALIPIEETSSTLNLLNKIELWSEDPINANGNMPKWTWEITNSNLNILQYASYNWNLKITVNGKLINESKAKSITEKRDEFIIPPYLYIPKEYIDNLLHTE